MIQLGLRGTKADTPWSSKPAIKSGLDIAPNPKIVASLRRERAEQSVSPFDVLRRREEGDEDGEHFRLLCRFGCA
jgi:hypothetical protein